MFSFIFIYLLSIIILFPKKDELTEGNFYSLIFASFSFSHALLGFISLLLITLGLSKIPILIISLLFVSITFLSNPKNLYKVEAINNFLKIEIIEFYKNKISSKFQKVFLYITFILLILIFISSIGPINHPDASDYHVGYPYQYYLKGGLFVDGGLHQGLLGIGDYANLSFIQEKTIWLIRFIQISNLPILVLFLSKKFKNNIFLISFLSIPTFIQWSTIGKPLFLGESSLVIIYLIWKENKTIFSLKLLVIAILNCISFKLSSLIIIFPIVIDLVFNYSTIENKKINYYEIFKYVILNKVFILSSTVLISIFISRFYITGNFAYPLLTNIFNSDQQLVKDFAQMLSSYKRSNLFFINIFIPTNISDLGQSLGPNVILLFTIIFYKYLRSCRNFSDSILNTIFSQFVLLILFCQGRADYYCAPLILLFSQLDKVEEWITRSRIKYLFNISMIFQFIILNLFLSFSIITNIISAFDYTNAMNRFAYGFNIAGLVDKSMEGKILFNDRNTRFYYPSNYIDINLMNYCVNEFSYLGKGKARAFCLKKYKVTQIVNAWEEDFFNDDNYECKVTNSIKATRNIFNRKRYNLRYCRVNDLSK